MKITVLAAFLPLGARGDPPRLPQLLRLRAAPGLWPLACPRTWRGPHTLAVTGAGAPT